jgi:hypothetical protein
VKASFETVRREGIEDTMASELAIKDCEAEAVVEEKNEDGCPFCTLFTPTPVARNQSKTGILTTAKSCYVVGLRLDRPLASDC